MKILFVGVFSEHSTNNSLCDGLSLYASVDKFDFRSNKRHEEIINISNNYDTVLFCKAAEVNKYIVDNITTFKVLWYMDPLSSLVLEKERIWKKYDTYIVAKHSIYDRFKSDSIYWVCEGFAPYIDKPVKCYQNIDISFIGSLYNNYRAAIIQRCNIPIYCAYGRQHAEIVSRTKVNINICTNGDVSDRVYKILATQGFLLTDKWYGMEREGFIDGKHLVVFNSIEDLNNKINYYLQHDTERIKIASEGYKFVQQFSRNNWGKKVYEIINENINKK